MVLEIAVIPGDGVGPEMTQAALSVLKAVCGKYGHELVLHNVLAGGAAIDQGLEAMPEESLAVCRGVPAVLFGNSGLRKYQDNPIEKRPEAALMHLRRGLSVTTNIRPVRIYQGLAPLSPLKEALTAKGMDIIFVRDIEGGVFCSEKVRREGAHGQEAYEREYYNETIVEHTARIAFSLAEKRKRRVRSLDKANVLESSRLWRQTVSRIGKDYDVALSHDYIDHAAMQLISEPEAFDVMVTSNLFGDILSDEGTQLTGTQYLYASCELSPDGHAIYTPNQLHHPDESIIGKDLVNPIGMIQSVALMLRCSFQLETEAWAVERAVEAVLSAGFATRDIALPGKTSVGTRRMAALIEKEVYLGTAEKERDHVLVKEKQSA